jgi:hypothetical protein
MQSKVPRKFLSLKGEVFRSSLDNWRFPRAQFGLQLATNKRASVKHVHFVIILRRTSAGTKISTEVWLKLLHIYIGCIK